MNSKTVEISDLPVKAIPILSDKEAGEQFSRWSFLNVYSLNALRDIYLITKETETKTKSTITKKVNTYLEPDAGWEERKVLEYLNALVKFGLLYPSYEVKNVVFENSRINTPLSNSDCQTLREIFFSYFRFKEISSWFISTNAEFHKNFNLLSEDDFIEQSRPLYYYCDNNRFTDTFLIDLNHNEFKYVIENEMSHLMRFWDVYLKWGTTLNVLDKFNLSTIGLNAGREKELSIVYFIKQFRNFDLIDFIVRNFRSRHISIPELIFKIVLEYRYSVEEIKAYLIKTISESDRLTYERTSQIFIIKGKQSSRRIDEATYLYPRINDSFISNIILRK
ncbi:MAG TPA: hypothetical protein VF676_12710 [Flavobacterium sp.]